MDPLVITSKNLFDTTHSNGHQLLAKAYNSGFEYSGDCYNSISAASNGKIYYILSSPKYDVGGQLFSYSPDLDVIEHLGDLTEMSGEAGNKSIVQGRSHADFYEFDNRLFFSSHVAYYQLIEGRERMPQIAPTGYSLYPGGHIISYDLTSGKCINHAIMPKGEGVLSMIMDTDRGNIFTITWPTGMFIYYNLQTGEIKNKGRISGSGEEGRPGEDFRSLCRSLLIDPRNGIVYFSNSEGDILFYNHNTDVLDILKDTDLRKDYFGQYDFRFPGSMSYNWRKIFWYDKENVAYGVHGNSGYLFRFDPSKPSVEIVDRITSLPSKICGMFDQFSYGYLGFQLGTDEETIYYLTGGPVYEKGKRLGGMGKINRGAARGIENLHLITYHLPTQNYKDHGPLFYQDGERPSNVNSIALDKNGNIYTLARMTRNGKTITDLVKISNLLL